MPDDIISEVKPKPNLKPTKLDLTSAIPLSRGIGVLEAPEKRPVGRPPKKEPVKSLKQKLDEWPMAIDATTVSRDVLVSHSLRLLAMVMDTTVQDVKSGKPLLYDPGTARAVIKDLSELLGFAGESGMPGSKSLLDLDGLERNIAEIKALMEGNTVVVTGGNV